eukprot:5525075-Pyramimonas_sp.AAC.1
MSCTRLFGCGSDRSSPAHPYVAVCAQEFGKALARNWLPVGMKMHRAPPFLPKSRDPGPLSPNAAFSEQRAIRMAAVEF